MEKQLLIYQRAVPLSVARYGATSVKAGASFAFAAEINAVPLLATEIAAASAVFPVVFGIGDTPMPVAVLGLRHGQNLFIDDEGRWTSRYTPAFLRQYPFVFARSADGEQLTLCIDDSFDGVNTEGRGERLFDADGERTQYLTSMLTLAQAYQRDVAITEDFCRKLASLDLFEDMQAQVAAGDAKMTLTGFRCVAQARLKQLGDEDALSLFRMDGLDLIYRHLSSLGLFGQLAERAAREGEGEAEQPAAPQAEEVPADADLP